MKTVRPWAKALGISDEDYQRWSTSVPAGESMTFRCLSEGRIPVDAYLDWAKEHFGLPVLRSEFFLRPFNSELYSKLKSVSNWTKEALPVHEWDGVVFVACVEPHDVTWSFPVQYVLASPQDLEKYWITANAAAIAASLKPATKGAAPTATAATPPAAPTPIAVSTVKVEAFPATPTIPVPTAAAAVVIPPPPPAAPTPAPPAQPEAAKTLDPFEALNAEVSKIASANTSIEGLNLGGDTKVAEAPGGLEGLNLNLGTSKEDAPAMEGLEGLNLNLGGEKAPSMEGLVLDLTATNIAPAAATPAAPAMPAMPEFPDATMTNVQVMPTVPAMPVATGAIGEGQDAAAGFLKELSNEFLGAMIMKVEGEMLQPWAWDARWTSEKPMSVSLASPSAFRVVYRTKMPYLGHIVETEVNSAFFKDWGFASLPESLLVQPVMSEGVWLGMLVLQCDKAKKHNQLLATAEKMAATAVTLLSNAKAKAA